MNHLKPIILAVIATAIFSQCRTKKQTQVANKTVCIHFTENYCGGAAPPDEMIQEMRKMKPFANQQIEVFKSNSDDFKPQIYKTNDKGEVILPLSLGNQVFISCYPSDENYALKPKKQDCYRKFITNNLIMADLTAKDSIVNLFIDIQCNPCIPVAT